MNVLTNQSLPYDPLFMRRLLAMLAHAQGGIADASQFGSALGVN